MKVFFPNGLPQKNLDFAVTLKPQSIEVEGEYIKLCGIPNGIGTIKLNMKSFAGERWYVKGVAPVKLFSSVVGIIFLGVGFVMNLQRCINDPYWTLFVLTFFNFVILCYIAFTMVEDFERMMYGAVKSKSGIMLYPQSKSEVRLIREIMYGINKQDSSDPVVIDGDEAYLQKQRLPDGSKRDKKETNQSGGKHELEEVVG